MKILITGCCGLIGSAVARHFCLRDNEVVGIDNNMRRVFFGEEGDTSFVRRTLEEQYRNMKILDMDIRDEKAIFELFSRERFDAVVHCAAQPSHDKAREFPLVDFAVNANGTMILLEANRLFSAESPFVFMSTNKVYGDGPNSVPLVELDTRWSYGDEAYVDGIREDFSIDSSKHSIFGASKVAADIMVQEYGRYFDMPTCCLRGGCLTGPAHAGVELHGFLSYLVKCNMIGRRYTIYGYKGKQVRDNIHSDDVAELIGQFLDGPGKGRVFNLGGGRENSISIIEAFEKLEHLTGREMCSEYVESPRSGDHICYYSDLGKLREAYPKWRVQKSIDHILVELVTDWERRLSERR